MIGHHRTKLSAAALAVSGIAILAGSSFLLYQEQQYVLPPDVAATVDADEPGTRRIESIAIPSANIQVVALPGAVNGVAWKISDVAANYIVRATSGAVAGNTIVYGHNKRSIFANLKQVQPGDTIALTFSNGSIKEYTVELAYVTDSDDMKPIQPSEYDILTIYTCAGFLDTKRLIVRALPAI